MTSRNCFPRRGSKCSTVKVAIPMSLTPYYTIIPYLLTSVRYLKLSDTTAVLVIPSIKGVNKVNKVSAKCWYKVNFAFSRKALFVCLRFEGVAWL